MSAVLCEFQCPRCGKRNDTASGTDHDERPEPGSIAVCICCAAPLELRAAMPPKWLTWEDVIALPAEARNPLLTAIIGVVTLRPSLMERPTPR